MTGTTLSHYEITAELGRGGMGIVYKAWDTRLERDVAIKVVQGIGTGVDRERIFREARAAAKLSHPNIATVHEVGEEDGKLFIVMEYAVGETLAERMDSGLLPLDEAVGLLSGIASGLQAAHAVGITHRDIKPGNIIVSPNGTPKILDFGLAKAEGAEDLTREGSTVGTIRYMSPEQARGDVVDTRSDLWSLGVIMYGMFAGKLPYEGSYEAAVLYQILNEEPDDVRALRADLPDDVAGLVHELLSKDPAGRPASAGDVLARLSGLASSDSHGNRPIPRKPLVITAVTVLLLITVAAIWWQRTQAEQRWVEEVGRPALDSLQSAGALTTAELWRSFRLAQRIRQTHPDEALISTFSLKTDPPGARIAIRDGEPGSWNWVSIGQTPLDSVAVPDGTHLIRISRDGYATEYAVRTLDRDYPDFPDSLTLHAAADVPEGMLFVRQQPRFLYGLLIPQLEHVESPVVSDFYLDRYEVTNRRYQEFVDDGGYANPKFWQEPIELNGTPLSFEESRSLFLDETGRPGPATWSVGRYPDGEDEFPVRGVAWYEAQAFALWSGGTLPTIFHWAYATHLRLSGWLMPTANIGRASSVLPVGTSGSVGYSGAVDLGGNVREWMWNIEPDRGIRYVLGGAYSDEQYRLFDGYAVDPLERDEGTGFRTMQWIGEADTTLLRPIPKPFRDYAVEEPFSVEEFERARSFFAYDPVPLDAIETVVDSTNADFTTLRVEYDTGYGERMYGYLYLPRHASAPYETLIFYTGDGAWNSGTPAKPWSSNFLIDMVKDGRAVFAPVFRGLNDRVTPLAYTTANTSVAYRDHTVMWTKEFRRSVDYVVSRGDVDEERIGYMGYSWGSMLAPILLAVEPRIEAAVLVVGGVQFQQSLPEADVFNYLPHVSVPVLMLNGRYDFYFPVETSQRPFFNNLGSRPDDKDLKLYETAHGVPSPDVLRESLAWYDRYLTGRD